ncbi:MAG: rod shape-determining protein [Clostridia bacterium]|nr:rod shape-determining protein [Clostridia bacterium]
MVKLAVDLGSSMTKIYRADTGNGIVLAEPSCVAVVGEGAIDDREVKAVGKEAKNLIGKTAVFTGIVQPVYEGEISNMRLAALMLKEFFTRIGLKKGALRRAEVLFTVPCGAQRKTLSDYAMLAEECGLNLRKVYFVEQPYLAALGGGAVLSDSEPVFCLDIGGGVSNVAVVSADGIIAGLSMNIGGSNMDANIIQKIARVNHLDVGALTAEKIKNEICSLSPNARGSMVAQGSSTDQRRPASAAVQANVLSECIRVYVDKVIEYACATLRKLPAEVAATVNRNGVFLSGGIMKIPYVPQYIGAKLEMRYRVCEEPQFASVLGGGALIRNKELLRKFAKMGVDFV